MKAGSVCFGVGSLLDLLQAWLSPANPLARITQLVLVHRDRPRNFFPSCDHCPLKLHWFRAFDREPPMVPETTECIKHGLRFDSAYAAATHCVVEHPVAILPRAIVLPIGNIMQHGAFRYFPSNGPPIIDQSER